MSMTDRFPDYDLSLPSWILDAPDEPFDPADVARRAALQDLRSLDPMATAQSAVDLKLDGGVMSEGIVGADAVELFSLFQAEVEAATPVDRIELAQMRLVGSSPGSVILHLAPAAAEGPANDDALAIPGGRTFDSAVARVLDLHDRFEKRESIETADVKPALRDASRRFVDALQDLDATVAIDAYSSHGAIRRSSLSRQGREFAVSQFLPVEQPSEDIVFGILQSVDLDGTIVLKGRSRARDQRSTGRKRPSRKAGGSREKKFEITGVPVAKIKSGELVPGNFYGFHVSQLSLKDPMRTKSADRYSYLGRATLDSASEEGGEPGSH